MNFNEILKIKFKNGYIAHRTINELIYVSIIPLILGIIFLIIKYRRLNYTQINLRLTESEFKHRISEIAYKEKWNIVSLQKNKAKLRMGSMFTWGLIMTINRKSNCLMINSICDVDSKPCISILNENSRNIKELITELKASA